MKLFKEDLLIGDEFDNIHLHLFFSTLVYPFYTLKELQVERRV